MTKRQLVSSYNYELILTFKASWPVPSPSITAAGSKFKSEGISATLFSLLLPLALVLELVLLLCISVDGGTLGGPVPPLGV